MTLVSDACKKHRHHPEWSNIYNKIFIRWTTHNPRGLSSKDIDLARICDDLASKYEVDRTQVSHDDTIKSTITRLSESGDCCK